MSPDLAKFVGEEALRVTSHRRHCSYCQGREDHDISCMAIHFPDTINAIQIGFHQKFWVHPVKLGMVEQWNAIWETESAKSFNGSGTVVPPPPRT
jgi:hypothetical protein